MLYIPKIDGYFKKLTGEEVKCFVAIAINFNEYSKTISEEQNLRKVVNHFISF